VHGRDHHYDSVVDVPFARAEKAEQKRIWIIVLDHAPESGAQCLGSHGRKRLLEFFVLAVLVVFFSPVISALVLVEPRQP